MTEIVLRDELEISKRSWERIYDFGVEDLKQERADFFNNKLEDHFRIISQFNLSWLPLRFYNNIPSTPILRSIFECIHLRIFENKILEQNFGYELSFTQHNLKRIHKLAEFKKIDVGAMAFHPSPKKLNSRFLRNTYHSLSKLDFVAPVWYVSAYK